jgi:hypothetical protein
MMVAVNKLCFARIIRFLVQLLDAGHFLSFFADFDAIASEQITTADLNEWTMRPNNLVPASLDAFYLPG